ncbi:unnamed protein product [Nyctereutes procyonoides]|uniref:Large ribosomal subunit protein uL29 n=1 Tax=Nyctereutes procyonoides TaxID=34880 RepID=A0A811YU80_NYCPR|nr:unnamed protein product [Nyctereutes procyonoides]
MASKLSKIHVVCKSTIRVLTVINQTQRTSGNFTGVRSTSTDLRPRKTPARCHWLNQQEENLKTKRHRGRRDSTLCRGPYSRLEHHHHHKLGGGRYLESL